MHGVGNFGYFDFLQWPHDTNLSITALLLTISEIAKIGPLPRRLRLQMDNCVRENKNKYMFGFLSLLVEKKIFSEVCNLYNVAHTQVHVVIALYCSSAFFAQFNMSIYTCRSKWDS